MPARCRHLQLLLPAPTCSQILHPLRCWTLAAFSKASSFIMSPLRTPLPAQTSADALPHLAADQLVQGQVQVGLVLNLKVASGNSGDDLGQLTLLSLHHKRETEVGGLIGIHQAGGLLLLLVLLSLTSGLILALSAIGELVSLDGSACGRQSASEQLNPKL